jgi:predicted nuclease of restriction endonuclease-like RecB superfamily
LLDDASIYENPGAAAVSLRRRFYQAAASMHPVVTTREGIFEQDLASARQRVSEQLGMTWDTLESELFADVIELQKLKSFPEDQNAIGILSRYNVAQTQAALYRAVRIRVDAFSDFKTIISRAKLARLMHHIDRIERPRRGYRFLFDGPASVLRQTTRYGIGFAKLLTSLLHCSDWQLNADLVGPGGNRFTLSVSSRDGLKANDSAPDTLDSDLEREVLSAWRARPVAEWSLEHETELLVSGQVVMTPDFVLRHRDGRVIHVEVVGFWTPQYLAEKAKRLALFRRQTEHPWLLLFPRKQAKAAREISGVVDLPYLLFDKHSDPAHWIERALHR